MWRRKPGGVGEEVPRGAVRETGVLFDVPYGQLHPGMSPVEGVRFDRGQFGAGGEGMVSPVRATVRLGGIRQPGAAHNHPYPTMLSFPGGGEEGLRYLRLAVLGVADGFPPVLSDVRYCFSDLGILRYGGACIHVCVRWGSLPCGWV